MQSREHRLRLKLSESPFLKPNKSQVVADKVIHILPNKLRRVLTCILRSIMQNRAHSNTGVLVFGSFMDVLSEKALTMPPFIAKQVPFDLQ
jgi:hypothetical protein